MVLKEFYTTGDVAQLVNISRATVSRKFDAGILRGKKNPITGERLISYESLLSFMMQYDLPLKDLSKKAQKSIILGSSDEQLISIVNQTLSGEEDIKIYTVSSGYDVLIMCSKDPTDLLIIDDEITDISCAEAVKSLKRFDEQKSMKILCIMKTYNPDKFMEIGADEFLAKDTLEKANLAKTVSLLLRIDKETQPVRKKFDHDRRSPRISVNIPTKLEVFRVNAPHLSEQGNARVKDISLGGAYLSQISLDRGSIPSEAFRFLLRIDKPPLNDWQAECKVARLQADGDITAGVQFVNISQQNKDKIADMDM